MLTRRQLLASGFSLAGGAALTPTRPTLAASNAARPEQPAGRLPRDETERQRFVFETEFEPGRPDRDYRPVITPNGRTLPFRVVDGVKVYHLVAEEIDHEFAPGLQARCWSYNGGVHGPTIEAVEGDRIRVYVTNRLPAPTTVHWHGLILPSGMDGVSGLTQPPIPPGETWKYDLKLRQHGTFMYHSHHDSMTQDGLGMTGMFIIHPREPVGPTIDRDYALMLHEWKIDAGAARPDPFEMTDFNILTINAKVFPFTDPLLAEVGDRVRIRIGNLSAMDHHPIHLHGYEFYEAAVDGFEIPPEQRRRRVTVLVGVGQTRDIEFVAEYPGDWVFHCHMTHHMMNQMGHAFPNMVGMNPGDLDRQIRALLPGYMTMGVDGMEDMTDMGMPIPENSIPMLTPTGPFGPIDMGGMAGVLKVRDRLNGDRDPGWFDNPEGSVSSAATPEELRRDGIG